MRTSRLPLLAVILLAAACGAGDADLKFDEALPGDVRELARKTWNRFAATFPDRLDCIPDVTLVGAWELDEKAVYEPDTATIYLRIPGTAGQLETSLVHEFGHHLDSHCSEQGTLRNEFMMAQGVDSTIEWSTCPDGSAWEDIPAEQFAEATVLAVLDYRLANRHMPISPEAVELVRRWGGGDQDRQP